MAIATRVHSGTGALPGKRVFLETLRAEGVRYIFGNPGTSEAAIMEIMGEYPDMQYVLVVQEGVSIGLAEGYARASGEVAFVSLHIDNGLVNAYSLMIDSYRTGTPMVVTAGNKDVRKLAEGRSDLAEMTRPFAKWSVEVTHPDQLPSVMRRAFTEARTPPTGPVFVSLAGNIFDLETSAKVIASKPHFTAPAADPNAIEAAAELLSRAERPVILVGDRVSQYGGVNAAVSVAERIGARVYGHISSEFNFPTGHPQWFGGLALRQPAARKALTEADVVLAIGGPVFTDFFYQPGEVLPPETKLIHLDINAAEIGKSEPTEVGIFASPKAGLEQLAAAIADRQNALTVAAARERAAKLATETAQAAAAFAQSARQGAQRRPMSPSAMAFELGQHLPTDAIVFDDSISTRGALHGGVKFNEPGSLYGARGGAIGWGIGATLGVKLAQPSRPVVGVIGDGSAMMTAQGLWTAAASKIPVVYCICNNGAYRILKVNLNIYKQLAGTADTPPQYFAMDFNPPFDFAALARAFGVHGVRIEDPAQIGPELKKAIALNEPVVLDMIIDGSV